jgi:DNA polymerase
VDARLASDIDIAGFRSEARQLLARQVPPELVHWHAEAHGPDYTVQQEPVTPPRAMPRAAAAIVPPSFQRLSELVVMHRDADRFSLLYRLLWRMVHEPALRSNTTDEDLTRAQHMGHAVRRDIHKTKTQLRFHAVGDLHVAWCEPVHHIVESVAQWLTKRAPGPRWALLSPQRCVWFDGHRLLLGPGLPAELAPAPDAPDEAWLDAWRRVFQTAPAAA